MKNALTSVLNNVLKDCLKLVFPKKCAVCGEIIPDNNSAVCEKCFKKLRFIHEPSCKICAKPKNLCKCKDGDSRFYDSATAAMEYDKNSSKIIWAFKFYGKRYISPFLSEYMIKRCNENFDAHFDAVTYVPLGKKRRRERGFNQAELLAREVAKALCIPCENMLVKTGRNRAQHTLSRRERILNVKGVYSADKRAAIAGKNILLIDDVLTTGATMNECAMALKKHGANKVCALSAAVTVHSDEKNV